MGHSFLAIGHNENAIERRNERAALFNHRATLVKRDQAARRRAALIDCVILAACAGIIAATLSVFFF